jgi:hypothetical protein
VVVTSKVSLIFKDDEFHRVTNSSWLTRRSYNELFLIVVG